MIMQKQQAFRTRPARLIAVGNRISLSAARSEETFSTELTRVVELAVPHLSRDRPNLVVLGEMLGLPLALTGQRGSLSRRMSTSNISISLLAPGYARRMLFYRRLYPAISLVRSLLLSLADVLYRPFVETLGQLAARHNIYLSASQITAHVQRSTSSVDIRRFGRRGADCVYLPDGPGVYNTGFLWGPDGQLIGTTDKVFLTEGETSTLDLTPGELDRVQVYDTEIGRVGLAISLDAFTPQYLRRLDSLNATIVIQNDANDQPWASPSKTCDWQPPEWLNSVLGCLQDDYPNLHYNICAMQVGNFFDLIFDGQSTITHKSDHAPDPSRNLIGNDGFAHTVTGKALTGEILAISPWVADDPITSDPSLSLAERRKLLHMIGEELQPGGTRVNQYRESVIWADVDVPVDSG